MMGWFVSSKKEEITDNEYPVITVKERLKKIEIHGFSRMTLPHKYYAELSNTLENYFYSFNKTLILNFRFEYINTSSAKWLHILLASLSKMSSGAGLIEINWFYEHDDETILETGELLQSAIDLPIYLKAY